MGKKKVKSKRKTELRIIFFIILVAAALFIISTYAWFSTQRNVSINNLSGIVEVAEGLEISLNGSNWANEIILGTGEGEYNITDSSTEFGPYEGHRNISPKELLPVSTIGKPSTAKEIDLKMIRGKVTGSKTVKLSEIVTMNESLALDPDPEKHNSGNAQYPGYFAFDIFLKNSSKDMTKDDILQLNYDSSIKIIEGGNDTVGLQNTVRVAMAKYGTGEISSGSGVNAERKGAAKTTDGQADVLKKTGASEDGDEVYITDVAIWEPNASDHVEFIVDNNNKVTWNSGDSAKYDERVIGKDDDGKDIKSGFTMTTQIPTYAVKETALAEKTEIKDIYLWNGNETHLEKQMTLQTTRNTADPTDFKINEGVQNLISTSSTAASGDGAVPFAISPNCIVRLRVYVWLEGQDVDCINYASYGGGVTINLGIVKGSTIGSKGDDVESLEPDGAEGSGS